MSTNLVDLLKGYITPDLVSKASSMLGAPESSVARALPTGLTAVLAGLAGKASDTGAMGQIFTTLTDRRNDGAALSNPGSLLSGTSPLSELGNKLLSLLFGDRLGSVESAVSQASGVQAGGGSSVLKLVAPIAVAALGDLIRKQGLGAGDFAAMVNSQKDSILAAAPAGLSSLLGAGMGAVGAGVRKVAPVVTETRSGAGWVWPVILLALVALGLWWLLKKKPEAAPAAVVEPTPAAAIAAAPAAGPKLVKKTVCNNDISAPQDGIEMKTVAFIEDKSRPVDQTTWFDFDRLLFETGAATLKPESSEQLKNVAAILTCYPAVKVKIGGYTDNTGNAAANLKLSDDRAANVRKELVGMGIAADRLTSEGYVDQHPVGDNNTEEGRAKNRRISLRVTAK